MKILSPCKKYCSNDMIVEESARRQVTMKMKSKNEYLLEGAKRARYLKRKSIMKNWQLYLLILLPMIYFVVFHYAPMYGLQLAFRGYSLTGGFSSGNWVGFDNFKRFITSFDFKTIFFNTISLSILQLVVSIPIAWILAFALNYCKNIKFKKIIQSATYLPYFISVVVLVSLVNQLFNERTGMINQMILRVTGETINFLGSPDYFKPLYVFSTVWQQTGYNAIIYLAALTSVPPSLHEAARVDGASIWKRVWHIDFKTILPTIVIMLILQVGNIMSIGYEKALLFQNSMNLGASEIIPTYVYKVGIASTFPDQSYATAIGMFSSVINLILIVSVNKIAKKVGQSGLW